MTPVLTSPVPLKMPVPAGCRFASSAPYCHTCQRTWRLPERTSGEMRIRTRLGHANVTTTLQVYGHLFPNSEDDLNARLEALHKVCS